MACSVWGGTTQHWITLFTAFLMMLTAGTLYSFSAFSDAIKEQLNLSESEATMIVTIGNFGLCIAPPSGKFCDRFGPRKTAIIGGLLSLLGFLPYYLVLEHEVFHRSINSVYLSILYAIVGQGSIFTYVAAICTYKNFPAEHQGKVIGILDCGFGLSAFVFSSIYNFTFGANKDSAKQNLSGFILFLISVMVGVNILGYLCIRIDAKDSHHHNNNTDNNSKDALGSSFIGTGNDSPMNDSSDSLGYYGNSSPDFSENANVQKNDEQYHDTHGHSSQQILVFGDTHGRAHESNRKRMDIKNTDIVWHILLEVDFWLLFISFLFIQSGGLLFVNNMAYIAKAVSKGNLKNALTILLPLASGISRIVVGFISDVVQHTISRTFLYVLATMVLLAAQLLITFFMKELLVLNAVLVGMSFGSSWCLTPLICTEQFGEKNFGFNWGFLIMASAFGGLLLQPLQATVYERHKRKHESDCYGTECYQLTFLVSSVALAVSVLLAIYLCRKFKKPHQIV